jgi:hypothetical protein
MWNWPSERVSNNDSAVFTLCRVLLRVAYTVSSPESEMRSTAPLFPHRT